MLQVDQYEAIAAPNVAGGTTRSIAVSAAFLAAAVDAALGMVASPVNTVARQVPLLSSRGACR